MANEILVLERQIQTSERESFGLLFLSAINPPILDTLGTTVVPTPSSTLPQLVLDHALLSAQEIAALDNGTGYWVASGVTRNSGETVPDLIQRVREMYAATMPDQIDELRNRYSLTGTRVNA